MLEKSDTSIADALKVFNAFDIEVGLIVPTPTGMIKSIMDATASLRDFLRDAGVHDYESQAKGQTAKVVLPAYYVTSDGLEEMPTSLYRPETKNGDPRIWFSSLKKYAEPFNLLAVFVDQHQLFIVNCSTPGLLQTLHDPLTPLGAIAARRKPTVDPIVAELLDMIQGISRRGFIPTLRAGDTGIGMTLETLLGIAANTSRTPDYKGIEIKAKRLGRRGETRTTLFSQAPDWRLSPIGSAWNLLFRFGYERAGKLRLNHELDAKEPNSIGFLLEVDTGRDWLKQIHRDPVLETTSHLVTWQLEKLRSRLAEKHPQTFWVGANCRGGRDAEEFHYIQVQHTRAPRVRNFDALLEAGLVSVDYLMSQRSPGRQAVRDHGYLFKMHPRDFDALFPISKVHVFA
jgi:hypothetical protein